MLQRIAIPRSATRHHLSMNASIKWLLTHRKAGVALALSCAALSFSSAPAHAVEQTLRGHVPLAVARLTPMGRLPASQQLRLAIGLPLRNRETLTNLLHDLYDPASPLFRQYLTPQQFTDQFGPSEADYQAVIAFARANNLTVTTKHPNRLLLDVVASVADIEKALHVTMRVYQHPKEARTFYSCDVEPSLDLATPILTISGLNNYQLPHPNLRLATAQNKPNGVTPNSGSAPTGDYMGGDFRAAYVPGTQLTGAGQVIGLLQFDGYYTNDIALYESMAGLTNVPLENVLLDGYDGVPTGGNGTVEVSLDIEMVISMAPGLAKVIVYEAGPFGFPDDILNAMATENRARQLSASWGWGGGPSATTDQIFQQMIAQGQTFFHSSGDSDAFLPGQVDDPLEGFAPSDSPYITQVGGTTLTTSGPLGAWVSEKVWNWGGGEGSCGGISAFYQLPIWQKGISMSASQGSTTFRNVPDVALTADNVFVIANNGLEYPGTGGTSCASPLWAGFAALVNQQGAAGGLPPVGFLNPTVYAIGKSAAYTTGFHDTVLGDNTWFLSPNLFFAVPGYDLCTGWGTPAGTNLINALLAPPAAPSFVVISNSVSGGNGNGVIDFNECDTLNLVLANVGTAGATSLSATLSTTTPGVAIAQATASYPNIPAGGSGTNLVPFKISTSPFFTCGTPIDLSLLLQCDQVVTVYPFSLPSGVPGNPLRFDNNITVPIPSPGLVTSPIVVSNVNSAINKVTVSLFVNENFDYALSLALIAPDGTTNLLSANNGLSGTFADYGAGCSPDSQRTTFDDAAGTPIGSGTPPFVGTFRPAQPLAVYAGKSGSSVNGLWQLQAIEDFLGDTAAIQCWSLLITPTLCSDGGGQCPGADMALGMTGLPQVVIAENNLTYNIAVTNLGPSIATNVTVTHLLPPEVTLVSVSASQGTYSQQGGAVSFSLGPMSLRATANIMVVVQPNNAPTNYTIYSTATVSSDQPDFNPANNSVTIQTQVTPATADLAVGIAAVPNPVLNGGTLTYTVWLTNNGPSHASAINVTNALPFNAPIQSVTVSQGNVITLGDVVLWSLSTLPMGAYATATITVTPTVEGLITASATAAGSEFDPNTANNTASVTITVGPAADLALSLTGFPNAVVAGSNVTYTINVTNQGPSTATGVIVNDLLPPLVTVLSTNTSQGTISISNNTLICALGTLTNGASATIMIVAATTTSGTLTTTATISATQPDPNPANNAGTATTIVSAPFVTIVPAGARLTYESGPTNGAIDIGETVTVNLFLRDTGNTSTRNLVATLLTTNGVVPLPPNAPQTYGALSPSGSAVGAPFSFTANGTNGGAIAAVLQLQDGTNTYPPVSFAFNLPTTLTFANTNAIIIPDPAPTLPPPSPYQSWPYEAGPASPYPSVINVSNVVGLLGGVTVTLSNLNHTYPSDVNVLLVAPGGANALLMSHAGTEAVSGQNLTFDDSAPSPLPPDVLISGTYQPAAYPAPPQSITNGFPGNAPVGPYPTLLAALNAVAPNGAWSLYVFDDHSGDAGAISNGWSFTLSTISPVNQVADLGLTALAAPNPALAGSTLTYVFTVTNGGPNTATFVSFTNGLPAGVTLISSSPSQGAVLTTPTNVVASLGTLNVGAIATVTNVVAVSGAPIPPGSTTALLTNTASVTAFQNDLNPVNNSVSVVSTVSRQTVDLGLAQTVAPDPVVVGYSITNAVTLTNSGPGIAFNAVFTQPLPPGVGFIPASSSSTIGTITNANGTLTCALGNLASNATATLSIVLTNSAPGRMTNTVVLTTDSYDPNPANDTATYVATVDPPAPNIVNAGAVLTYESGPVNGAIDADETVTVSLALANIGSLDTTNLVATLLSSGGVTSPSGPQSYGALIHDGPSAARSFSFTSAAAPGGVTVATLQLQDGNNTYSNIAFPFPTPGKAQFSSPAAIIIPDHGPGTPYPATITVSGVTGRLNNATLTLNGLTHSFPHDINVVLVNPAGTNVLVMSHTGGGHGVTNINLTFDDDATVSLPNQDQITSGTYKPSAYEGPVALPGTAPSIAYQYALSAFQWCNPNGTWSLYVFDDKVGDRGIIAGGWSLAFTNVATVGPVTDLAVSLAVPATLNVGQALTNTITVTNLGPDSATGVLLTNNLSAGLTLVSASVSQGNVTSSGNRQVTCNLGTIAGAGYSTAVIVSVPSTTGSFTNTANVVGGEEDLNPGNNSTNATTTVTVSGPAILSGTFTNGQFQLTVTASPGYVYVVQGSTNLTDWGPLSTITNTTGTFTYTDTTTPAPQSRFYRTLRQ
jgi:uncharacterized repeat protein (TIGR01451 family)